MLCYVGEYIIYYCSRVVSNSGWFTDCWIKSCCIHNLLMKSLTWHELVLIKFKLKSPIIILRFFSRDIEFKKFIVEAIYVSYCLILSQ